MPIYEYRCGSCGSAFERRLSFEDRLRSQACPECDGTDTSLLLSVPARPIAGAGQATQAPTCPSTGDPCGCGVGGLR